MIGFNAVLLREQDGVIDLIAVEQSSQGEGVKALVLSMQTTKCKLADLVGTQDQNHGSLYLQEPWL